MSTRRYPISLFNTYSIHIQITSLIFTAGLLGYQGLLKNILFRFGHFLRQKEPKFHPIVTQPEKRGPKASPLVPCFVRHRRDDPCNLAISATKTIAITAITN